MSIFPMISPPESQTVQTQSLPLCREVAWDFQRDVPIFRGGQPVTVTEKEALKVWIWRALRCPRFRYEIYSWAYGSEFESLLVNPYITRVEDISVDFESEKLTVRGTAVTIYGGVKFHVPV